MNSDKLTKLKIEFADSRPKEFATFLAESTSDNAKELMAEALNFYISHNGAPSQGIVFEADNTYVGSKSKEYTPTLSWVEKITLAIKSHGKPATTNEIVDFILSKEPSLDRKKVTIGVSVTLSRTKHKKFRPFPNPGYGFAYDIITTNKRPSPGEIMKGVNIIRAQKAFQNGEYNPEMSWKDKIKYFINAKGGHATPSELNAMLIECENITDKKLGKKKIASLSSVLSQNSKEGEMFTKGTAPNGDTIYGIK